MKFKYLTEPVSELHAKKEMDELRDYINAIKKDQADGLEIDKLQLHFSTTRIAFLRRWYKDNHNGKAYPCVGCPLLIDVLDRLKAEGATPELLAYMQSMVQGRLNPIIPEAMKKGIPK